MEQYYEMLIKRKSNRKYDESLTISPAEMLVIEAELVKLKPLTSDIKVAFSIVKRSETTAKFGEYCLLMFSEKIGDYLLNAGYMLEQMDLFFTSLNIGSCWYGLSKPKKQIHDGLSYVIMITFGKSAAKDFRESFSDFKRKAQTDVWKGDFNKNVMKMSLLAPSAVNSQPWYIESSDSLVSVYRNHAIKTFIPSSKRGFFNTIDLGIFLFFLEVSLNHENITYERKLFDSSVTGVNLIKIAQYQIK